MYSPRMKSLENSAHAAGSAFGFDEGDFDRNYVPPVHPGRVAALLLAVGGGFVALAHHFGLTGFLASITGLRAAA